MKIFISWSGDTSRKVAELLREWLPSVIQAVEPYVSSEDIDKGARWSADIASELEGSNFGILCVTRENLAAPWINFEAGALSKAMETSRVAPVLVGVGRAEVVGPLLQFQSTICERNELLKLVRTINAGCVNGIAAERVESTFDVWWPTLDNGLKAILQEASNAVPPDGARRSTDDLLDEVLELVRGQQKILSKPEELLPPSYFAELLRDFPRGADIHGLEMVFQRLRKLQRAMSGIEIEDESKRNDVSVAMASLEVAIVETLRRFEDSRRWPLRRTPRRTSPAAV